MHFNFNIFYNDSTAKNNFGRFQHAENNFYGRGQHRFAKNVLGDVMLTPSLKDSTIALYDIDPVRLNESYDMLCILNENCNEGRAEIIKYTDRKEALRGAKYIVNAIQVGGYDPCTITDFEVPKKYGLRQTIGDTLGIGEYSGRCGRYPYCLILPATLKRYALTHGF